MRLLGLVKIHQVAKKKKKKKKTGTRIRTGFIAGAMDVAAAVASATAAAMRSASAREVGDRLRSRLLLPLLSPPPSSPRPRLSVPRNFFRPHTMSRSVARRVSGRMFHSSHTPTSACSRSCTIFFLMRESRPSTAVEPGNQLGLEHIIKRRRSHTCAKTRCAGTYSSPRC